MFDENSPEMRLALAPYEASIARFDAAMEEIGAEFQEDLAQYDKHAAERNEQQAAQLKEILERERAEREREPEQARPGNGWPAPRAERPTVLTFDPEDADLAVTTTTPLPAAYGPAPYADVPTPPTGFPAPTQAEQARPEPKPPQDDDRVMTFGVLDLDGELDTGIEPPQPSQPRHARGEDDGEDDDYSNRSWLR